MTQTRREFLQLLGMAGLAIPAGGVLMACGSSPSTAATPKATGLLAELQAAKTVKIGIANQPPYSGLNPDGSISGVAPEVVQAVMKRLGVPNVQGIIAPYADLIPGLQARRWDIIGADFTITKARCGQVSFVDPITFDGGSIAYLPSEVSNAPTSIAAIGQQKLTVGILSGSYLIQLATSLGVPASSISQFPDNPSLVDALMGKRVKVALSTYSGVKALRAQKNNAFNINYPLPDDKPHGAGPALRNDDQAFYQAFQRELANVKKSGELDKLNAKYGFDTPKDVANQTAAEACAAAS